jgi:hypothetical protein
MKSNITMLLKNRYIFLILISIKLCAILFATLIFSKFTPLVDSNLYLQGYYEIDKYLRTRIIHHMAVFLYETGGSYFAHSIFAMISTIGLIYYYLSGGKRLVPLLFLLLPSSLVWTSIVGKEAIFFGASGLLIAVWSKYIIRDLKPVDITLVTFGILICAFLRPHYTVSFVWLFFSIAILKNFQRYAASILISAIVFGLIIGYLTIWNELLLRGFGGIDPLARASRNVEFAINQNSAEGFDRFKELVFLGLVLGIVGPLPSEVVNRIEFLPFFLEGLFILFSPLLICLMAGNSSDLVKKKFYFIFCWSVLPSILILIIVHAPFGLLNPGSATRWRTNFEQMFYLAPLLLLFRLTDNDKKNSSLSS